jgi:hypothetical protein
MPDPIPSTTPPAVARWYASHEAQAHEIRTLAEARVVLTHCKQSADRMITSLVTARSIADRVPVIVALGEARELRKRCRRALGQPVED